MHHLATRFLIVLGLCSVLLGACTPESSHPEEQTTPVVSSVLAVQLGVQDEGYPTPVWIEAIRERHDEAELARLQQAQQPLALEEQRWVDLIQSRSTVWSGWVDSLSIPFSKIAPLDTVLILLGNAGGEDAFTFGDSIIAFDVSKLHEIYGLATTNENQDRIDRFFAHEITHVLHKAWFRAHPVDIDSPLAYALWDCLVEGMGNYRSLSSKWVSEDGVLTPKAEEVLAELQPVFVERLVALDGATEEESILLLEGLSSGPFTQKWGALTSALWLAQEAKGEEVNLQPWVEAGPWGVLELADKYLPAELGDKLAGLAVP